MDSIQSVFVVNLPMDGTLIGGTPKQKPGDGRDAGAEIISLQNRLKVLETQIRNGWDAYDEVSARLAYLKGGVDVAELRAKYEGRYWKLDDANGYVWRQYMHCLSVTDDGMGIFDSFEMDARFSRSVVGKVISFTPCEVEITRGEYLEHLKAFMARIGEMDRERLPDAKLPK